MMEIGPFQLGELERIQEILTRKNVAFEVLIDEALKETLLADFHEKARTAPRQVAGALDLRIVFFTLDPEDYPKVKEDLEKFGIVAMSDGAWELSED